MVASYTQLLAKRYQGRLDSDADEFISYAVDGCNRMQGLIRDLLAYSRSGTENKLLREISGETALNEALANLSVLIEESGTTVTHDLLPTLTTDNTQLVQVLQNLIGNAIKYRRDEPPRIHIHARATTDEWVFSVTDNGIGIDAAYAGHIFELFKRLHGQDHYQGSGIGLSLCQRILEQYGGRIWMDESTPGVGTTFTFAIPMTATRVPSPTVTS